MDKNEESNLFTSVDVSEQVGVEGGTVALEYLFLATIIGLSMIVGVKPTAPSPSTLSTNCTVTALR